MSHYINKTLVGLGTPRELLAVAVEIERILNSRPLTYVDDELQSPLTASQ